MSVPDKRFRERSHVGRLLAIAVILFATWHRFDRLDLSSLWVDEIGQVRAAVHPWSTFLEAVRKHHAAVPVAYLIQKLWLPLGKGEFAVRYPAAFFGILTVALMYKLGRDAGGERGGFFAALFAAMLPQLVYYSREARFYSIAAMLSALLLIVFVQSIKRGKGKTWGAHAVIGIIGQMTHGIFALNYLGQFTWVFLGALRSGEKKRFMRIGVFLSLSFVAVVGVFGLWWFLPVPYTTGGIKVPYTDFSMTLLRRVLKDTSGWDIYRWQGKAFWALVALGAIRLLLRDKKGHAASLWLVLLLFPAVVVADNLFRYFFSTRQLISAQPMIALLGGVGGAWLVTLLSNRRPRWLSFLMMAVVAALIVFIGWSPLTRAKFHLRTDWRLAAQVLRQSVKGDEDVLWYDPPWVAPSLRYYGLDVHRFRSVSLDSLKEDSPTLWGTGTRYALDPLINALREIKRPWIELDLSGAYIIVSPAPGVGVEDVLAVLSSAKVSDKTGVWYLALGNAYEGLGRYREAEAAYEAAIEKGVTKEIRVEAMHDYAVMLMRNNRRAEALEILLEAYRIAPDNAEIMAQIGYVHLLNEAYEDAVRWFDKVLRISPQHYWAYRLRGESMYRLGRYREAVSDWEKAWELRDTDPNVLYWLGQAKCAAGDREGARAAWEQYLNLAPTGYFAAKIEAALSNECGKGTGGNE